MKIAVDWRIRGRALLDARKVVMKRLAVGAGLAILAAGGDFVDGVIAYDGNSLGGETLVSLHRSAVAHRTAQGHSARLF